MSPHSRPDEHRHREPGPEELVAETASVSSSISALLGRADARWGVVVVLVMGVLVAVVSMAQHVSHAVRRGVRDEHVAVLADDPQVGGSRWR